MAGLAFAVAVTVGACTDGQNAATPGLQSATATSTTAAVNRPSASGIAEQLKIRMPTITLVVTITEDNDPNNLIGRPNGYLDAAVVFDSTTTCADLGSDCGAMIEIWPTAEAAQQRATYIATLQQASPILGSEYHHLRGPVLLRVTGAIKPSANAAYSTAFNETGA